MFDKIKDLFTPAPLTAEESYRREWDKARESAMSPSERAEIDAIFGRQLIR